MKQASGNSYALCLAFAESGTKFSARCIQSLGQFVNEIGGGYNKSIVQFFIRGIGLS